MKKTISKKTIVPVILISAVGLLFLIVQIVSRGSVTGLFQRLAGRLLNAFTDSYRFIIAYTGAVVLLAGTFFLVIHSLLARRSGAESREPPPAHKPAGLLFPKEEKRLLLVCFAVILLFWAPYLFQGENIHVKIFDNLDSHIPHTKVLAESGKTFSLAPHTKLDNFLNGIRLSGVDSGYNIMTWLFMIFPPFIAFAFNDLLVRVIALLGMVFLLKKYVIIPEAPDEPGKMGTAVPRWLIFGAALCFSLLPFYPAGGISIAGIPLLLFAFLNILHRNWNYYDYAVIFIFPFYSKLALAGFFIAVGLFVIWVIDSLRKKKINLPYLAGLALLTVMYCFTHFHLLYSFMDPNFTSFREEIRTVVRSTFSAFKLSIHNFLFDRVNVAGAQHIFVIGAAALAVALLAAAVIRKQKVQPCNIRLITMLVITALLTSILWGFKYWKGIMPLREQFQLLNAFDLSRFYWLNPFLWYLVFALALFIIVSQIKAGKIIAAVFIIGQLLFMFVFYNWEYRHLLGIRSSFAGSPLTYSLSFKEFYSENLFEKIQQHINRPKKDYRVVSLGIHPGISQFNGFYTLDIYTDIYSLEYKHQFRKIIAKELEKSSMLKTNFDENAKRCFLFASELHGRRKYVGLAFTRGIGKSEKDLKLKNLELNADALKALGGEYIFSAVEIVNYKENRLTFDGIFKDSESPWKIYLYRVL